MVLGGLALAFSRLIDNSVVVLENIFRHLEMGKDPVTAAEVGGKEVAMPVLAATFTTMIVFFPSPSSMASASSCLPPWRSPWSFRSPLRIWSP